MKTNVLPEHQLQRHTCQCGHVEQQEYGEFFHNGYCDGCRSSYFGQWKREDNVTCPTCKEVYWSTKYLRIEDCPDCEEDKKKNNTTV